MSCLRCGRNTANQQVFCDQCQEDMTRHPVKSDTPIHLPVHKPKDPPARPSRRKKEIPAEEMVVILQNQVRRLLLYLIAALLVLALVLSGTVYLFMKGASPKPADKLGQNYQTANTVSTTTSTSFTVTGD